MSDTLFGRERSGTPLETRGATSDLASLFQQNIRGQMGESGAFPFGRLQADAASMTSPLFASMEPFEDRLMSETAAQMRETMSGMGGRFGTSATRETARGMGEVAAQLARAREETLLNTLMGLGELDARRTATMAGFLQPGAPIWQEGIAGDLLTAGGMAAGYMFPPAGAAMTLAGSGGGDNFLRNRPSRTNPFDKPRSVFDPFETPRTRNIFDGL